MGKILDEINETNDIKKIEKGLYGELAEEIREFLLDNVSRTGGHLASNLGVVELTMALHLVMDFPKDKLIFDVGHQSYTHKVLTGRKEEFKTLRQLDGMSGFPKTKENLADSFNTGHSSTSLSAALGFAQARNIKGTDETIVALIGDGALSGGMAFEALNNIGQLKSNMIIVLNDNKMSISKNVGGMSKYLNKIRVGDNYNEFKGDIEKALLSIPKVGMPIAKTVKRSKDSIKHLLVPGMLFEDMGITYVGPVDGHNVNSLVATLRSAKTKKRPILVHVITKKGKGYRRAERFPERYHGIDAFDLETGKPLRKKETATYTDVFSRKLVQLAAEHKELVAITAAMPDGTGLSSFEKEYPNRFFDVGIAEEHAVTFAAGLAAAGLHPIVAVYSSFFQRAYDQILHDVCIQNFPVILCVDRSGIVGADGETHQGIFDISYLTSIPNMTVVAPKNRYEMSRLLEYAVSYEKPIAIKYPRGAAWYELKEYQEPVVYGKSEVIYSHDTVAVIAVGKMMEEAYKAYESLKEKGIFVTLINARFVKPIDKKLIKALSKKHDLIITIEDNVLSGGYGQAVNQYVMSEELPIMVKNMAINDCYVPHGTVEELQHKYKLDSKAIVSLITKWNKRKV